ncbi:MAG: WD40 repeat domain-containing serine/threonine protein kinase [Planctomycetia bacterium]
MGTDLGGVIIVRRLAEGGMGRVYEARQLAPDRAVAVKVVREGFAGERLVRRCEQEAHMLARLRHPHVAQIYMLGTFEHDSARVPYFVMELVAGALPIDRFAGERRLSVRERMVLVHRVAAAVAHGHRLGIVHRDLKPGNLLVGADGEPKVIDFGVARPLDADMVATTLRTDAGEIVGTLRYMSPEQLDADPAGISSATDVYALGLVIHELLTGELPYELRGATLVAAARIVREQESPIESRVRQSAVTDPTVDAAAARRLAAIVGKCLRKPPAARYPSASELEMDLARWLAGEPVVARPEGWVGRCGRLMRRHRAAVVVATMLVASVAVISLVSLETRRQRELAASHESEAVLQRDRAAREAAEARVWRAAEAFDRGHVVLARSLVAEAAAAAPRTDRPPIEVRLLAALLDDAIDESLAVLRGHTARVTSVAAAGPVVVTGSEDGTARIWSAVGAAGWTETHRLEGHTAAIWGVAVSADGTRVATASADQTARIWDAESGQTLGTLRGHDGPLYGVAFAPDGSLVATASADRTARLWTTAGVEAGVLSGHDETVFGIALSGDGARLATASRDKTVRLWDVARRASLAVMEGHERRVFNVGFAADDGRLVSASEDGTARVWNLASQAAGSTLVHPARVNAAVFGPGGTIVTGGVDGLVRIWDPQAGHEIGRLRGHSDGIWSVAILGDGRIVTGSADTTARIWDPAASAEPVVRCGSGVLAVAVATPGTTMATGHADGSVGLWDLATLRQIRRITVGAGRVNGVAFSPDGGRLAAACQDGFVHVVALRSDRRDPVVGPTAEITAKPTAGVTTRPEANVTIAGSGRPIYAAVFAPDGDRIATACDDGRVRIYDLDSGDEVADALVHRGRVLGVSWSPDGSRIATACGDRSVRLWPAAGGGNPSSLDGHTAAVNWVAFSPAGDSLASCSSDGTVRLWEVESGRPRAVLEGPVGQVWEVAFSPDGSRIAAVGVDRRLHLWEAESGRHLLAVVGHGEEVWAVAFTPDGAGIVSGSWDGTARVWGRSPVDLQARRGAAR